MVREILYVGEVVELSDYEECNRYKNQSHMIQGIPMDPIMRPDFDRTPNDERETLETEDWWGKPYIVSRSWQDYDKQYSEWNSVGYSGEEDMEEYTKESWHTLWPAGTRYEVRCLNGWCWDGSTRIGIEANLDDAIKLAQASCSSVVAND